MGEEWAVIAGGAHGERDKRPAAVDKKLTAQLRNQRDRKAEDGGDLPWLGQLLDQPERYARLARAAREDDPPSGRSRAALRMGFQGGNGDPHSFPLHAIPRLFGSSVGVRFAMGTALKRALLAADMPLPPRFVDHPMKGQYSDCRDCHLRPDPVLVYRKQDVDILELIRIGTHAQLAI